MSYAWIVAHRPTCLMACGIFPGLGIKSLSPTIVGGFFTTAPSGKPHSPWGCKRVRQNLATKQEQYAWISYLLLCNKLSPKCWRLKLSDCLFYTVLEGQKHPLLGTDSGECLAGCLWLRTSPGLQASWAAGGVSSHLLAWLKLGNPLLDSLAWLLVGLSSFLAGSPRGRGKDKEIPVGFYPGFSLTAVGLWAHHWMAGPGFPHW